MYKHPNELVNQINNFLLINKKCATIESLEGRQDVVCACCAGGLGLLSALGFQFSQLLRELSMSCPLA